MSTRCWMQRNRWLRACRWWPRSWRARPPSAPAGGRAPRAWRVCSVDLARAGAAAASRPAAGSAPAGGWKSASGSSLSASAACSRAMSSCVGQQIALQMVALGGVHRRIELDQHVACLDALPVLHMDRAHHAGLERLDDLGAAARHDLARCRGHDVDRARRTPRRAPRRTAAMMVTAIARPIGDGGVSTISSAAGRKASSSRALARRSRQRDDLLARARRERRA